MSAVYGALSGRARRILSTTSYDAGPNPAPPPLLRIEGGRPVFCCRDFVDADLEAYS